MSAMLIFTIKGREKKKGGTRLPDRENVLKGLECCTFILGRRKCNECPYQKGLPDNGCYQLQDDFHALLKEQEAVEPINSYGTFRCGNCGNIVGYNDGHGRGYQNNFCSKCGQAVKWE